MDKVRRDPSGLGCRDKVGRRGAGRGVANWDRCKTERLPHLGGHAIHLCLETASGVVTDIDRGRKGGCGRSGVSETDGAQTRGLRHRSRRRADHDDPHRCSRC